MKKILIFLAVCLGVLAVYAAENVRLTGSGLHSNTALWSLGAIDASDSCVYRADTVGWDTLGARTSITSINMSGYRGGIYLKNGLDLDQNHPRPLTMSTSDSIKMNSSGFISISFTNASPLTATVGGVYFFGATSSNLFEMDKYLGAAALTVYCVGSFKLGSADMYLLANATNQRYEVKLPSFTCGNLYHGSQSASAIGSFAWGNGIDTMVDWKNTYNANRYYDSLQTATIVITGSMSVATKDTIICGTSVIKFRNAGAATHTTNNQLYYSLDYGGAGGMTQSGNLRATSVSISAGTYTAAGVAMDSCNNLTMTTSGAVTLATLNKVSGSFVRTGGALTGTVKLVGTGTQSFTSSTDTLPRVDVIGGGLMMLMANLRIKRLDDSLGTVKYNGYKIYPDTAIISDSAHVGTFVIKDTAIINGSLLADSSINLSKASGTGTVFCKTCDVVITGWSGTVVYPAGCASADKSKWSGYRRHYRQPYRNDAYRHY